MILAARPAMGKTALALNIAENVCFKNNIPVGIFSLEMTAEQLLHRIICSQAEVESDKIRTGPQWHRISTHRRRCEFHDAKALSSSTISPALKSPTCAPAPAA